MAKLIAVFLLALISVAFAQPSAYQEYVRLVRSPYENYNYNPYDYLYQPYNQYNQYNQYPQQYQQQYPNLYEQGLNRPAYNRSPIGSNTASAQASSSTGGYLGGSQAQASAHASSGTHYF